MFNETVKEYVHSLMSEGKASDEMGWSMCAIEDDVRVVFGESAAAATREYIIRDVCGIEDPNRYIDDRIKRAHEKWMYVQLFDTAVGESEISKDV